MSPLVAVLASCRNEPFTLDGIASVARRLRFEKIFADGRTVPACDPSPEAIVNWLDQHGYIRCGCLVGEDEDLAVVWILAAEYANGKTPESFSQIVGRRLQSATVAFYPSDGQRPAHLESQVAGAAIKRARARHPGAQRDLGVEAIDPVRRLRTYGLA